MISGSGPVNPNIPPPVAGKKEDQSPNLAIKIIKETQTAETGELSQKSITYQSQDIKEFIKLFDLDDLKEKMDSDIFICWEAILKPYHSKTERENQLKDLRNIFENDKEAVYFTIQFNDHIYITPVIASILNYRPDQLKVLLDQDVDVNTPYFGGNTLSHFAAITGDEETIKVLKEAGANFDIPNMAGSTANDYLEHQAKKMDTQITVHPFKDDSEFNQETYYQIFKSNYLERKLTFQPVELLAIAFEAEQWGENLKYENKIESELRAQLIKFLSEETHAPKVYLTRLTNKDDSSPVPEALKNQWEARSCQEIKAGELIGEYTGSYLHNELPKKESIKGHDRIMGYGNFTVDAHKNGNLLAFINDGFPNCAIDFVLDAKGIPHAVVYALREISEDEALYFNYGKSFFDVLGIEREVLNPQAVRNALSTMQELAESDNLWDIHYFDKAEAYLKSLVGKSSEDNLTVGNIEEIERRIGI